MQDKTSKKSAEYKAGLFIIISLVMLIFSILWLRYFSIRPVMEISAKFKDPGPVTRGLQVYYQGVIVGKISNIDFSEDFQYTLVKINIYREGLNLPENIKAKIEVQGITGQKYISLIYPKNPSENKLRHGSVLVGESPFSISDFQEMIGSQVKNGNIKKMFDNLSESFEMQQKLGIEMHKFACSMNSFLQENRPKIEAFFDEANTSASNMNKVLVNLNEIVGDNSTKQDIKSTIKTANDAATNMNKILQKKELSNSLNNLDKILKDVEAVTSDKEMQDNLKSSVKLFAETENTLSQLKLNSVFDTNTLIQKYFPQNGCNIIDLAVETLCNANQAAKSVNCLSQGMSEILNKRFAMMRLLFGKPGESLEACKSINKLTKEQADCLQKQGVTISGYCDQK